jgi:hypothetical protein
MPREDIPNGYTCRRCAHYERCADAGLTNKDETACHFNPPQFVLAPWIPS